MEGSPRYKQILDIISGCYTLGWSLFEEAGFPFSTPPTLNFVKACGRQVRLCITTCGLIKWLCWDATKEHDPTRAYLRAARSHAQLDGLLESGHAKLNKMQSANLFVGTEDSDSTPIHDHPATLSDELFDCEGKLDIALESADEACDDPASADGLFSRVRYARLFWKLYGKQRLEGVDKGLLLKFFSRLKDIVNKDKYERKQSVASSAPYDSIFMEMLLSCIRVLDRRRWLSKQRSDRREAVNLAAEYVRQWQCDHPRDLFARMYRYIFLFRWPTGTLISCHSRCSPRPVTRADDEYKDWSTAFEGTPLAQQSIDACADEKILAARTYEWVGRPDIDPYILRGLQLLASAAEMPSEDEDPKWLRRHAPKFCARMTGTIAEVDPKLKRGKVEVNGLKVYFLPDKCEPKIWQTDRGKGCHFFLAFTLRGPIARDVVMESNKERIEEDRKVKVHMCGVSALVRVDPVARWRFLRQVHEQPRCLAFPLISLVLYAGGFCRGEGDLSRKYSQARGWWRIYSQDRSP